MLVSPTVNSDEKERAHIQSFVLTRRTRDEIKSSGKFAIVYLHQIGERGGLGVCLEKLTYKIAFLNKTA